ncbi:DNA/RNA helicase domain-containing protein [Amycolatopsis magusensis]|uniref:DNA/RNA helicase domain-containing protein n=1 Tax=Amycolatopsis magusensis TaxID=882444 RepID=UPI003C2C501C
MTPIRGTASQLRESTAEDRLARKLAAWTGVPYSTKNSGELRAWRESLPTLFDLLCDAGLGHIQVLLEYQLPYCPRRVDAVLCGVHPEDGQPSYALVELKQWDTASMVGPGMVKVRWVEQPLLHPAEQVRRYCRYLLDYTPSLARRPTRIKGLAYLHNAIRSTEWDLDEEHPDDFGQLYTADLSGDLAADLMSLFSDDPATAEGSARAARELTEAGHLPGRTLLKTAAAIFARREDFVLLDEQQVAFESVIKAVESAREDDGARKKVIVVQGGPGSGKSAIAISLFNALAGERGKVMHATGSKAFTENLRVRVATGDGRTETMFTYFNQFQRSRRDGLEVLICDEAQRIRHNNVPEAKWHRHPPQVGQLINAAKVPVFLLDEDQRVRPAEVGNVRTIEQAADRLGCQVVKIELDGQFRCGGSAHYDQWVLRLLGLTSDGPVRWRDFAPETDEYVVDCVPSPHALEQWLKNQMSSFSGTARMAAGFCWEWSDPVRVDGEWRLVDDVQIGGWRRPWNVNQASEVPGAPSASLWASDPAGFDQVGCVYTAQGFEYDWAGVIFGKDLVIRDGAWRADQTKTEDHALSAKKVGPEKFGVLVRNAYKVLMTRGMHGVCLYSVDEETNAFFREHVR